MADLIANVEGMQRELEEQKHLAEEKALSATVKKNPPILLEMTDRDKFAGSMYTLDFMRDARNNITGFSLDAGRVKNLVLIRK